MGLRVLVMGLGLGLGLELLVPAALGEAPGLGLLVMEASSARSHAHS